jgi:arylformamidase
MHPCKGFVQFWIAVWADFDQIMGVGMSLDRDYTNGAFIPDGDRYPARWQAASTVFRATANGDLGLRYGPLARQTFDLFRPKGATTGLLVYIHGGYWKAFGPADWSHLAAGALAQGWACAVMGYTLAPDARIAQMTAEVARGIAAAAALVPGPVVVTGHSAGGHLAARMGCADVRLAANVVRVVPISPVAELEPLMDTAMNEVLLIDPEEAVTESPARLDLRAGVQAHVWVGGQERPAFLWQARTLSEAWDCPWTVAAGRHHFDVVDDLMVADSRLMQVLTAAW